MQNKITHLQFIQQVITRMNTLSFQVKGWCVTLVTGLFIVGSSKQDISYVLLILVVTLIFYGLDAFYLSQERQYRDLYNDVRQQSEEEITFNMDTISYKKGRNTWSSCLLSISTLPVYAVMLIIVCIIMTAQRLRTKKDKSQIWWMLLTEYICY